jgi:hypothetical protein
MPSYRFLHNLIQSQFFAPRGRRRIFDLGMQIAQQYLSPHDKLIGFIGDAGSGKSALIKGMFPGLELTNDDDGVNVRPLPILDVGEEHGFFNPHTYHLDIRFETGFTQIHVLADLRRNIAKAAFIGNGTAVGFDDVSFLLQHKQVTSNGLFCDISQLCQSINRFSGIF